MRVENLTKVFRSGEQEVVVFDGLDLEVREGELLALVGRSGSGKTTLLHLLAALDTPTKGEIYFGGQRLGDLSFEEQAEYRNQRIGFVWQMHHLLPEFSALENVMLPQLIAGSDFEKAQGHARELLAEVGLENALGRRTGELSGGEQQRVALARALVNNPALLLADEPTGNLDSENSDIVLKMLRQSNQELGQTVLMITHNPEAAAFADRQIHMRDGEIVGEEHNTKPA